MAFFLFKIRRWLALNSKELIETINLHKKYINWCACRSLKKHHVQRFFSFSYTFAQYFFVVLSQKAWYHSVKYKKCKSIKIYVCFRFLHMTMSTLRCRIIFTWMGVVNVNVINNINRTEMNAIQMIVKDKFLWETTDEVEQ